VFSRREKIGDVEIMKEPVTVKGKFTKYTDLLEFGE
jgi:hypothetical protein